MTDQERITILLKCINKIGDYFEYAYESDIDKKVVTKAMDNMMIELKGESVKENNKWLK